MKKKGLSFTLASLVVALIMVFNILLINKQQVDYVTALPTRTVELKVEQVDYESILNSFDDAVLTQEGSTTYFEGSKTFNLADFQELDLVSDINVAEKVDFTVKYSYTYDNETNIVTLTASASQDEDELIDTMIGVAFVNDAGEIDAIFDCDGEYILLSELQDAGMIENCGWFKNICKKVTSAVKKVTNTVVGKVGAVLTVAVPAVIGVVCAVAAAPVVATVAIGALVGAGIAAGTAAISTYQQDGKVDWETVGICTGVGGAVGALSAYAGYKITNAIKSLFPKANPSANVKSFDSYNAFKNEYGKASEYINNGEWHHIVEQQTVEKGINGASSVYNSQNTVAISKNLHTKISGYYSRIYQNGMTFRQFVNTLSYEEQYVKGLEVLKMFAEQLGETIIWL